jgi:hypothetical protein
MEPIVRRTKKMAKNSALNTGKTAIQAEKKTPAVPASQSTSWRDEEELVDYEPESPPSFSPAVEDFPSLKIGGVTQGQGRRTTQLLMKIFASFRRKTQPWRG